MAPTVTYASEFGSGEISWAMRLAVDPTTGDVLVADDDVPAILRYDPAGTLLDTYSLPAGQGISGVSVTNAGKIWATMFYTDNTAPYDRPSLYRLAADGTFEEGFYFGPITSTTKVLEPNYVHVGGDGKVYVASSLYNCGASPAIERALGVRHASDGSWEADIGAFVGCANASPFPTTVADGEFGAPMGITTDSAGNVYVADGLNLGSSPTVARYRTVHKFDSGGTFQLKFGGVGTGDGQFAASALTGNYYDGGMGLAVDADDNIYVADAWGGKVNVYDSAGTFLLAFGTDEALSFPGDVAIGADGSLYVIDGTRVVAYTVAAAAGLGVRGVSVEMCGDAPC